MKFIIMSCIVLTFLTIFTNGKTIQKRQSRGSEKYKPRHGDEPIYGNNIPGHEAQIADQYFKMEPNASYQFGYLQTDLQRRMEEGTLKEDTENNQYVIDKVTGYYKYVRPDGKWQRVDYEADENGFRPIIVVTDDEPTDDESVFELLNRNKDGENVENSGNSENAGKRA